MAGSVNQTTIFSVKVTVNSVCHFYVVCQKKKKQAKKQQISRTDFIFDKK